MQIKRITPDEAKTLLEGNNGYTYLDVRTSGEFTSGHVPDARNIPLLIPNPAVGGMVINLNFVAMVENTFSKDAKIIVGCQAGHRSLKAAELLQEAGFENVVDMRGGFGGESDHGGCIVVPGWAKRGFPIAR